MLEPIVRVVLDQLVKKIKKKHLITQGQHTHTQLHSVNLDFPFQSMSQQLVVPWPSNFEQTKKARETERDCAYGVLLVLMLSIFKNVRNQMSKEIIPSQAPSSSPRIELACEHYTV
jgi:hypothetical protein